MDAKHHLVVGKCDEAPPAVDYPYRRRRETTDELEAEFAALQAQIDSNDSFTGKNKYGQMASAGQLNKLEGLCRKFVNAAFNDDSLADCNKLGAWKNRANQLLDDLVKMKNVCIKQAEEAAAAPGGGGYNAPVTTEAPPAGGYNGGKKPGKPNKKPKY